MGSTINYTKKEIQRMSHMHFKLRMSLEQVAKEFDTSPEVIESKLCPPETYYDIGRPIKAAPFSGWDFSRDNLVEM